MKYILFFAVFLMPSLVKAEMVVSEISWMGTGLSANAEWIELQNTGDSSVNLAGWTLKSEDGSPSINLSGSISAGAYALLERTSDSTVPGVTALLTYSGALANDGEHLVLRDGNGNIIQSLNFSSGWPAGNNTNKETMQWNGSIWITASQTPGVTNATFDSGGAGDQGTGGGSNEEVDDDNEQNDEDDEDDEEVTGSISSDSKTPTYTKKIVEIKTVDSSVPAGSPVKFYLNTRDLKGANIIRGHFVWNMGDGTERFFNKNEKFEHTYDHEGTYVVYLKYYSTYFEDIEPEVTDKITVTISSASVLINKIHLDGSVEIKNISSQEIEISNWSLKDNFGKLFTIPEGTYVPAGKTLVLNSKRTRMNPLSIILLTPSGSFAGFKEKFPSVNVTSSVVPKSANSLNTSSSNTKSASANQTTLDEGYVKQNINLNDTLLASTSSSKQKQPSLWIVVFVLFILGVCIFVFFLYKNKKVKEEGDTTEEDDFQLID